MSCRQRLRVDVAVKSKAIGREVMDGNGFYRVMALTFFNLSEDSFKIKCLDLTFSKLLTWTASEGFTSSQSFMIEIFQTPTV